jgi:hypothetical protein
MGVGVAVGVAVGVLVGVAVLVGAVVAVGNGVALGAGIGVGADTGAQADKIRLTSKNTINVRFILRILLWRSSRLTARASAAAKRAQASEAVGWKRMLGGNFAPWS